jgi:single-stranded-DNA-specific exonuclease
MGSRLHPVVEDLLEKRGITEGEREGFLSPDYTTGIHDPFLFTQMTKVCDRLMAAMEKGESVVVHGDYDADGICGSAVVISALTEVASRAGWSKFLDLLQSYLPNREGDGYGMSIGAVESFKEKNIDLIITVDCGISNVAEIDAAYEYGMEVIVVDHHQLPQVLSKNALSIHPLAPGEEYPFKKLAAVGVAYKLATALYSVARNRGIEIPDGYEKWLLDFVAIATVTDMVPLVGENRVLETYGLRVLGQTRRPGLKALADIARVTSPVMTKDVGFRIGPRINAPGRVATADVALRLMLSNDRAEAEELARELDAINKERQRLTESATRQATSHLSL